MEHHKRTLLKTATWRITGTGFTLISVYAVTGSMSLSMTASAAELALKPIIYYCHERVWNNIGWARK
ncbi:DUF2061 domain-containing protein [Candidatus Woesearchaeota archaeon]|nr:DUF2061 domain-containing protein [Candidatus Woesearchaeota archaeon]